MVNGIFQDKEVSPSYVPGFLKNAKTKKYKVKQGDTLYSLASQYNVSMRSIVVINQFHHERLPKAGKVIQIPVL